MKNKNIIRKKASTFGLYLSIFALFYVLTVGSYYRLSQNPDCICEDGSKVYLNYWDPVRFTSMNMLQVTDRSPSQIYDLNKDGVADKMLVDHSHSSYPKLSRMRADESAREKFAKKIKECKK